MDHPSLSVCTLSVQTAPYRVLDQWIQEAAFYWSHNLLCLLKQFGLNRLLLVKSDAELIVKWHIYQTCYMTYRRRVKTVDNSMRFFKDASLIEYEYCFLFWKTHNWYTAACRDDAVMKMLDQICQRYFFFNILSKPLNLTLREVMKAHRDAASPQTQYPLKEPLEIKLCGL